MKHASKISPGLFLATLLCFLFPFITVSCSGQKVASLTGVELAAGTTVEQPQMFGPPQKQKVQPEITASIAILAALLGLIFTLVKAPKALMFASVSGIFGAIMLLVMRSRLDDQVMKAGGGMFRAEYEACFYMALLFMAAGSVWTGYLHAMQETPQDTAAKASVAGPGP